MTSRETITVHAEALADLIEDRLGVRGRGLEAKLRRAGRAIPRYVRREAQKIVEASRLLAHPRLSRQVDPEGLDSAYRRCETWLMSVDPSERRKNRIIGFLATNAFNLVVIATGLILWAVWTGHL